MIKRLIEWFSSICLELLLVFATIVLLLQLLPTMGETVLRALDFRNWSRIVWFIANLLFVAVLVGFRFGPEMVESWKESRQRRAKRQAEGQKAQERKKQRETLERMQEARSKNIYK